MADIALHSTEEGLKDYVDEIEAMGISGESIYCELHEKIRTDPLRLGPYIDARTTLMFIAGFDRVVPTWAGKQLRDAIGRPADHLLVRGPLHVVPVSALRDMGIALLREGKLRHGLATRKSEYSKSDPAGRERKSSTNDPSSKFETAPAESATAFPSFGSSSFRICFGFRNSDFVLIH